MKGWVCAALGLLASACGAAATNDGAPASEDTTASMEGATITTGAGAPQEGGRHCARRFYGERGRDYVAHSHVRDGVGFGEACAKR